MKVEATEKNIEGKNGLLEPKKVRCSKCGKKFFVKFVIPRQEYSQKNNLGHWTERNEDKKKEWCNQCILALFRNKSLYWSIVKSLKRRQQMRKYIYDRKFSD
jgi:hypothetical protein